MPHKPVPIIPQTPEQARTRDQLAASRGQHNPDETLIAHHGHLRLVNTGHGIALQRHHQHFPLTHDELQWLATQQTLATTTLTAANDPKPKR